MEPLCFKLTSTTRRWRDYLLLILTTYMLITTCISQSTSGKNLVESQVNNNSSEIIFDCPKQCLCKYVPLKEDLTISCHSILNNVNESNSRINLSTTIKKLTIQNLTINFENTFDIFANALINNVEELTIDDAIIDPTYFLNSYIFLPLRKSLKMLQLSKSVTTKDGRSDDPIYKTEFQMIHFTNLEQAESLILCDNSPGLSNFFLNSLPVVVKHITIVKGSLAPLKLDSFTHLADLKSLNLSSNRIHSIPNGLGEYLSQLETMDLSNNVIEHLQEEVFVGFSNLEYLNLRNNKIRYIDTEVFTPLNALDYIDISNNEMIQIFDPYFENNKKLRVLLMSNTWSSTSFADEETAFRSLNELDLLINTLQSVETLDLSYNHLTTIPESLTHIPKLQSINLQGNYWECTCEDRWVVPWLATPSIKVLGFNQSQTIWCSNANNQQYPFSSKYIQNELNCTNPIIHVKIPIRFYSLVGKNASLKCHTQRDSSPLITWITPRQRRLIGNEKPVVTIENTTQSLIEILENGDIVITNVTVADFGLYICIASYDNVNVTHYVHLGLDTSIFLDIKYISIFVGWMTSVGFLIAVLTVQLVKFVLERLGIGCPKPTSPYNSRRVRNFFENMEQHNNSQLLWLRDNYNMQAKRIKDNCISQLERIRESYTTQTKNLSEIRDYGTQQLHTMRDQYYDQIRRVSSYSTQQLCRVRENYLFQRNRVCKFSSHQMLKLRETYKWQAQTLNKILENLPNLNFDTCRGMGSCGRSESIYLNEISEFQPEDILNRNIIMERQQEQTDEHISLLISTELIPGNADSEAIAIVIIEPQQPIENCSDYSKSNNT